MSVAEGHGAECRDGAPSAAVEAGGVIVALLVIALVAYGWSLGFHLGNAHNGLIGLSFTAVGLYVVRMQPANREGRLFLAVGILHAVMFCARQYGLHPAPLPGAIWIGWLGIWPLPLLVAVAAGALIAFPDGRLPSRRWRGPVAAMMGLAGLMAVASALWPVEYDRAGLAVPHPIDLPGADAAAAVWRVVGGSYLLFQLLWTAAVVMRMRRARGDEARQLRWLAYAAVMAVVLLVGGLVAFGTPVPGLLAIPLFALAAGISILKYRLYDIDPVINKTVVVGTMLLLITAGYVTIVLGLGALVPVREGWLSLLATAAVAVAFEPLRRRAQRLANRLVYGRRTTPYEALSRVSAHLDAPPDDVLDGIAATVATAVGASEVRVWVGDEDRLLARAGWPEFAGLEVATLAGLGPPLIVTPVIHRGVVQGAIALRKSPGETLSGAEKQLLQELAAQTALVVARQQQADELAAAARRIVTAEDAARHRIERNLHDGAQQRLVTLGLELGALSERADTAGNAELASGVKDARGHLLEATAELRELARGLHPMVLAESGLADAIATLGDRSPIPVRIRLDTDGPLPREVEATGYYVVSEALTNAARHSGAEVVMVGISKVDREIVVEVTDDGRGGAAPGDGTGLQSLSDRLAALGGRLVVDSPDGAGTRITAVMPCA